MKLRDYFDRIWIINLPERTDRRADMLWELDRLGLSPQPGKIEFFPAVKPTDAAGFENIGYHGCFRSHLEVYKLARATGCTNVVVFEDDAAISDRFTTDEPALIEQLQQEPWSIAYFGHGLEDVDDRPARFQPSRSGAPHLHFYAVNGNCLDRLIDFMEQVLGRPAGHPDGGPMSPDGALHLFVDRNPDLPCLVASPSLASQRSSRSDLTPKWFDRVPGLRETASTLRRVKTWLKK